MGLFGRRAIRRAGAGDRPLPTRLALAEPPVAVRLRVDARARRFTLRLAPEGPVLTLPPGAGEDAARAILEDHAGWLARALERQPPPTPVEDGALLPIDGRAHRIVVHAGAPRLPEARDGLLHMRPGSAVGPRAARWLKARARDRLEGLVRDYAEAAGGRPCARLRFADTRSRWGSCTSAGTIMLSWRLAMAPEAVQAYVAAHEAAHLVEMNHAPRYWAVLARLMPDYETHRAWLKREGRRLHAYRFEPD